MTKFDKYLTKSRWVIIPILYVLVCTWTYFGSSMTIEGVEVPQPEAGIYGVMGLHVMAFIATAGAYLLHLIVELISWIFNRKIKNLK